MDNLKPFGWAVIGAGRIANTVMREITATGRHRVVAVYSRTKDRAEKFAKRFGARNFDTIEQALRYENTEGVYIATPHSAHYPMIVKCVEAGIPVLCEKAFTVNREQAHAAVTAAEIRRVYLAEAMWMRFNPVVRKIKEWIESGAIGEIVSVHANFCLPLKVAKPFVGERVYLPEYAGGALLDLGVYPISYAHMLLGVPDSVECKTVLRGGVDYDDKIRLVYPNAECNLNCSFDRLLTYKAVICGTKGKIESPMFYKPNKATLFTDGKKITTRCKRGYIYQFDKVAEDIRSGIIENSYITHADTLEVMSIMDDIRKMARLKYPDEIEKI